MMRAAHSSIITTAENVQPIKGEVDNMNSLLMPLELPQESSSVSCKDLH